MSGNEQKRPLTPEEQKRILDVVNYRADADDKSPDQVIRDSYGGDRDKYLRAMARYYGIELED